MRTRQKYLKSEPQLFVLVNWAKFFKDRREPGGKESNGNPANMRSFKRWSMTIQNRPKDS